MWNRALLLDRWPHPFLACALLLLGCAGQITTTETTRNSKTASTKVGQRATGGGTSVGGTTASAGTDGMTAAGSGAGPGTSAGGAPNSGGGMGGNVAGTAGAAPPPRVVRPCPSDKASIGVWEQITPPDIPIPPPAMSNGQPSFYGSKAPLIDPLDSATIYLGIDLHGVYKSGDCGATWTKISTGRNGNILETGAQWSMAIDPVDPKIIYANNGYGSELGLWKSIDGGVNWDQTIPKGSEVATTADYNFVGTVSMDPTDRMHLVVSFHGGCKGDYAPGCLAETKDSAATWRLIKMPTGGAEASGIKLIDSKNWVFGVPSTGLWQTLDGGATWNKVGPDGGYILYHSKNGFYYLAGGTSGLLRSPDALTWTRLQTGALYSVVGDGETLYGSPRYCDAKCYSTSPESDGVQWTQVTTEVKGHGAVDLLYDPDHHIIYSSNETGGFWRVVTH